MNRILVGYDGSEPAKHALKQACRMAKALGSSMTVLTAAADRLIREDGVETMAADEGMARDIAEDGAAQARAEGVAQVDTLVSIEAPDDAIVLAAQSEAEGYDLVVVGHRSISHLQELFLGSTAKSVVDRLHCSVLVVR